MSPFHRYHQPVKIVHVESGRHLYGGARQVLYLIDELGRNGVENVLLCPTGSDIARAAAGIAADVIELPMNGDLDLRMTRRVKDTLEALRPDLVHVHSRRGGDLFGGLAASRTPWPAVLTRRVDHREWAPWARRKYSRYAAVIAISRIIETQLLEHVRLPRDRVHLVESGVDTAVYWPDPEARGRLLVGCGFAPDAVIIGVVAQLIPRKGHATLIAALPNLLHRNDKLKVLFFGRGPLAKSLRYDIETRGLGDQIKLLGFRDDVAALLPGIDILAHPASSEGMGVAVLEAMSAGVPVIASAVGGLPDVIKHGEEGLLVPYDDRDAWVRGLARLVDDRLLRRRMGASGRRTVQRHFTTAAMAAGNLDVYRAVLDGRTEGRGAGERHAADGRAPPSLRPVASPDSSSAPAASADSRPEVQHGGH